MITKEQVVAALGDHPAAAILNAMNLPDSSANTASTYLIQAFTWETTPQGRNFWLDAYRLLGGNHTVYPTMEYGQIVNIKGKGDMIFLSRDGGAVYVTEIQPYKQGRVKGIRVSIDDVVSCRDYWVLGGGNHLCKYTPNMSNYLDLLPVHKINYIDGAQIREGWLVTESNTHFGIVYTYPLVASPVHWISKQSVIDKVPPAREVKVGRSN